MNLFYSIRCVDRVVVRTLLPLLRRLLEGDGQADARPLGPAHAGRAPPAGSGRGAGEEAAHGRAARGGGERDGVGVSAAGRREGDQPARAVLVCGRGVLGGHPAQCGYHMGAGVVQRLVFCFFFIFPTFFSSRVH
jgi:hypothetical protein